MEICGRAGFSPASGGLARSRVELPPAICLGEVGLHLLQPFGLCLALPNSVNVSTRYGLPFSARRSSLCKENRLLHILQPQDHFWRPSYPYTGAARQPQTPKLTDYFSSPFP